jgi:serine/threonine-protein kinase
VAAAVMKSIEKLPADRFDTARQFIDALGDESFTHTAVSRVTTAGARPVAVAGPGETASWVADTRSKVAVAVIVLLTAIAGVAAFTGGSPDVTPQPTVRAPIPLDTEINWDWRGPRISANGRRVMLVTIDGIMVRDVDQPDFRLLSGTQGADRFAALSPDGDWVVFARDGDLFKISVSASAPITLVRQNDVSPAEPHWGDDGTIVFRDQGSGDVWRVSETGGDAELIGPDLGIRPSILPDGRGVIATTFSLGLRLLDLVTGDTTTLTTEGLDAVYAHTGHILFGHPAGGLFALPFDLDSRRATGSPVPVLDGVGVTGNVSHFDVSANGTLVFTEGGAALDREVMVVLHADGGVDTVRIEPQSISQPRFSPDGDRVTFNNGAGVRTDERQVWVYDLVRESLRQLSFDGGHRPVWSPDGAYVAYSSEGPETAGEDLWVHPSDGASDPRHLALGIEGDEHLAAWPLDTLLVFETQGDLFVANPLADSPTARPYAEAEYAELRFDLHPSGTFAAFSTNEYDADEIFVRDFPEPRGKWRISSGGGWDPRWSLDGRALYYLDADRRSILRHDLEVDAGITPLGSEVVWRVPAATDGEWDYHAESGRAVVTVGVGGDSGNDQTYVWIVVNWFEELRRLMQVGS